MPFFIPFLILLIISVGLFAAGQLFTKSKDSEDAKPDVFNFPTSDESRSIMVTWGTVLITSPQVMWWGDYRAQNIYRQIQGQNKTLGYQYFIGMQLGLCWGPLDDITEMYIEEKSAWSGSFTNSNNTTQIVITGAPFNQYGGAAPAQKGFRVDDLNRWGGIQLDNAGGEGGVYLNILPYLGTSTQMPDRYLTECDGGTVYYDENFNPIYNYSKYTLERIAYRRLAYVVILGPSSAYNSFGGYVGISAEVKPMSFKTSRWPTGFNATSATYKNVNGDANPVNCLFELYTEKAWGAGNDPSVIDVPSWQAACITCWNEGLGISHQWQVPEDFDKLSDLLLQTMDAVIYSDRLTGKIVLKLARLDYNINTIPTLSVDDIIEVEELSRESALRVVNEVRVEFLNKYNKYKKQPTTPAQDLAGQRIANRVNSVKTFYPVSDPVIAQQLALRDLRANSALLFSGAIKVKRTVGPWNLGDVFKLDWPAYDIAGLVMRVNNVNEGTVTDNRVRLGIIQDVFSLGSGVYNQQVPTSWTPVVTAGVLPLSTQIKHVEKPWELSGPELGAIWMVGRANQVQLNYDAWAVQAKSQPTAIRLGVEVVPTNSNNAFTPYGREALGGPGAGGVYNGSGQFLWVNIDTGVDLNMLRNTELEGIRAGVNLLYAEDLYDPSRYEWMAFEDIELTVATQLNPNSVVLKNIHRGLLNTTPKTFSSPLYWFYSYGNCSLNNVYNVGQFIKFDLRSRAVGGLSPKSAGPYTIGGKYVHTMLGTALEKYAPANVKLNSVSITSATVHGTGDSNISWTPRYRLDVPYKSKILLQTDPGMGSFYSDTPFQILICDRNLTVRRILSVVNALATSQIYTYAQKVTDGFITTDPNDATYYMYVVIPGDTPARTWTSNGMRML